MLNLSFEQPLAVMPALPRYKLPIGIQIFANIREDDC